MFLTKLQLNPRRRGARSLLTSPQSMHAAVLAGFADARPTEQGRILWRLDTYSPHRMLLYTVTPDKPDFTHLVEQAGWPTTECWQTRDYDGLLASLQEGQRWRFRLTANPVRSGRQHGKDDTQPFGHVTVAQQEHWLLDRMPRLGFQIPTSSAGTGNELDMQVVGRQIKQFSRQKGKVTISTATYEGTLDITDAAALRHTLTFGVGRAKAYGCGLLTLAPPPKVAGP